jgi:hypothetical protein
MFEGFNILLCNRTKKPLAIALRGVGRGLRGREVEGDLTKCTI